MRTYAFENHQSITMIKLYLVCNLCRQVKNQLIRAFLEHGEEKHPVVNGRE